MNELSGWQNFYVIMGSSAGALIGLQFVAITLIADIPLRRGSQQAGNAFATPNIVHFSAVLLLAGVMSAPWPAIAEIAIAWGLIGIAGLLYAIIVIRRMRTQKAYRPELEDWVFHAVLPLLSYVVLALSAYLSQQHRTIAFFATGGSVLLLLFIGIHNAWDAVIYHIFSMRRQSQQPHVQETKAN